ncbi:FAD/NAD(P)-binding domain-containing protein [Xylaria sp. FL0064]|nr:FAD/NAD(P)-binding domain-containing protein [Xylaria sp. FL0064]
MDTLPLKKPLRIGGSLCGLMCGIALKHEGHTITIIEKGDNERQSHMAGVCLGLDADYFLARHDRLRETFSHLSQSVQLLRRDLSTRVFVYARRNVTSWDALYFLLRSCFDGYISSYYPNPPETHITDGSVSYEHLTEALDIAYAKAADPSQLVVTVFNNRTQNVSHIEADLVIGADGPNSFVRAKYLPNIRRQYVGYIAWRGTVPEREVSKLTRAAFMENVTVYMMSGEHCIVYAIPGSKGTCHPGDRLLNFLWYTNERVTDLEHIMADALDDHVHHNIVPAGHVREEVWNMRLRDAIDKPLPAPLLEIVTKIKNPFIQVITEYSSPRAVFEDGKVLLVGDALSLYRPHTAFSATQAALHALCLEKYVGGNMSITKWEETVLRYALIHSSQSTWYGMFYQHRMAVALVAALQYWTHCVLDKLLSWWRGEKSLVRSTLKIEKEKRR